MSNIHSEDQNRIPFFSIITPVCNTSWDYFEAFFESVSGQTYGSFELIIVDDGSLPENTDFYRNTAEKLPKTVFVREDHKGVSAARNTGLSRARGKWILFADSDDRLEKNALEIISEALSGPAKGCEILVYDYIKNYFDRVERVQNLGLEPDRVYSFSDVNIKENLYRHTMGIPNSGFGTAGTVYYVWNKVYSRDFLNSNNILFDENTTQSEDKLFTLDCFSKAKRLYYLGKALYRYMVNPGSVSVKYNPEADTERKKLSECLEKKAKELDTELSVLKNDSGYNLVHRAYMRFIFGIISEVLTQKFYHEEYPLRGSERRKKAVEFLESEPFRSSIRFFRYGELGLNAKIKKFLLQNKMPGLFYKLRKSAIFRLLKKKKTGRG